MGLLSRSIRYAYAGLFDDDADWFPALLKTRTAETYDRKNQKPAPRGVYAAAPVQAVHRERPRVRQASVGTDSVHHQLSKLAKIVII